MKNASYKLLIILALILLLCSCAKKIPGPPAWINGNPDEYPRVKYMHAVGVAATHEEATQTARAEIAKQFNVKIETLLTTLAQYTGMEGASGSSWILNNSVSELTRTYVDETVQGIEIARTWNDTQKGRVYALAVLERSPARRRIEQRVMDLDSEIAKLVERSDGGDSNLARLRPLVTALALMKEREIKNNQLSVINPTGQGLDGEISSAALNEKLNAALEKVNIKVDIGGDSAQVVNSAVVASLNNGRLSVGGDGAADIIIEGRVKGVETNEGNKTGFVFAKFTALITLKDGNSGKVFGSVEHTYRDGGMNWNDARDKTLSRLAEMIVRDFNLKMYGHLSI